VGGGDAVNYAVLDLGHGGFDHGACHNGIVESDYVYDLGHAVEHALAQIGIGVLFTRDRDSDPSFADRARVAIDHCVCGTIVLHVNAGDPREHGPLAFHRDDDIVGMQAAQAFIKSLNRGGRYQVNDVYSAPMRWQTHVVKPTGWTSRAWRCLVDQAIPCCLVECEYCTHEPSARWLLSHEGRAALVRAIVAAAGVMVG
jgi:N-acetylmuramoyl-L-alanine amidase